ncbi:MAG: hypothetical protein PHI39_00325 [Kiritimatiellae bacterium]|nr:hypothetical protein [Kiritimatiellia bacterium]
MAWKKSFHAMEKSGRFFPHCGKSFHAMEKKFPRRGKSGEWRKAGRWHEGAGD